MAGPVQTSSCCGAGSPLPQGQPGRASNGRVSPPRSRSANPVNAVSMRFRVDGCSVGSFPPLVANGFEKRTQSSRETPLTFGSGKAVECSLMVSCRRRRAPNSATTHTFPSSFRLSSAGATPPSRSPRETGSGARAHLLARLEHLAPLRVPPAGAPEAIEETPGGDVANRHPGSGTLHGPVFHASVIPGEEHQTTVHPDGNGVRGTSVSIVTHDGCSPGAAPLRHRPLRGGPGHSATPGGIGPPVCRYAPMPTRRPVLRHTGGSTPPLPQHRRAAAATTAMPLRRVRGALNDGSRR